MWHMAAPRVIWEAMSVGRSHEDQEGPGGIEGLVETPRKASPMKEVARRGRRGRACQKVVAPRRRKASQRLMSQIEPTRVPMAGSRLRMAGTRGRSAETV